MILTSFDVIEIEPENNKFYGNLYRDELMYFNGRQVVNNLYESIPIGLAIVSDVDNTHRWTLPMFSVSDPNKIDHEMEAKFCNAECYMLRKIKLINSNEIGYFGLRQKAKI